MNALSLDSRLACFLPYLFQVFAFMFLSRVKPSLITQFILQPKLLPLLFSSPILYSFIEIITSFYIIYIFCLFVFFH